MPKTALLLLAKGAEELELITIADILARSKVNVVIAGISGKEVVLCSRGVKIQPDASLAEVQDQDFDAIILPGGLEGTKNLSKVGLSHV
ncbi:hypothetical protein AAHC03_09874 [Spirometra sp. Aus1]|nr:unnamed protein product [Spirometra erinaceieuropaei]